MKVSSNQPISTYIPEQKSSSPSKQSSNLPVNYEAAPLDSIKPPLVSLNASGKSLERPEDLQTVVIALSLKTLASQFKQEIDRIRTEQKIDNSWIPLIGSVAKQQDESYQITFINKKSGEKKIFNTKSQALIKYKELNDILYNRISPYIHVTLSGDISISKDIPSDQANFVYGSFYLIQALFKLSAGSKNEEEIGEGSEAASEGFEFYAKTQGATLENLGEFDEVIKSVENLVNHVNSSDIMHGLAEGIEQFELFQQAEAMLLDIINIATASSTEEQEVSGVKLGLDGTVGLDSLISTIAVESVSEFLGPLAIPLAGLSVGFGALASTLIKNNSDAWNTIKSLEVVIDNIKAGGYHLDNKVFNPGITAISDINLKNNKVTFGDMSLYPSHDLTAGTEGPFYTENAFSWTSGSDRKGTPLSIYKVFRDSKTTEFPPGNQPIVLPYTPSTVFSYDHAIVGNWIGSNNDRATIQKIRAYYGGHFHPFVSAGGLRSISKLKPHYKPTQVTIELDNQSRTLIVPSISDDNIRQNLSYNISAGEGNCNIVLPEKNIPISIKCNGSDNENYTFDISSLEKEKNANNIHFKDSILTIGSQVIKFNGTAPKTITLVDHLSEHTSIVFKCSQGSILKSPTVLVDGDDVSVYPNKYQLKPVESHLLKVGFTKDNIKNIPLVYTLHRYNGQDPQIPRGPQMQRLMDAVNTYPYFSQIYFNLDGKPDSHLVVDPKSGIVAGTPPNSKKQTVYGAVIDDLNNPFENIHEIDNPHVQFLLPYISNKKIYVTTIVDKDKTENHKCTYVNTVNSNNKLQLQLAEVKANSMTMDQLLKSDKANINDILKEAGIPETLTGSNPKYNSNIDAKKYDSIDFKATDSFVVSGSDSLGRSLAVTYKDHKISTVQGSWSDKEISYGLDANTCVAKSDAAEIHIDPRWWQGLKQTEFLIAAGEKSHDIFINTDSIPAIETSLLFDTSSTQPQQIHLENLKTTDQLTYAKNDSDLILFLNNKRIRLLDVIDDTGNISARASIMIDNQPVKISDLVKQIKVATVSVAALHRPVMSLV